MQILKLAASGLLLLAGITYPAAANTIINTGTGTLGPAVYAQQYEEQGWTQTQSYTNVSISVALYSWTPGQTFDIQAYLTTAIGSGTTTALATDSFSSSTPNSTPVTYLLFSGLTLPAGSYYLTLASTDSTGSNPGALWPYECFSGCPLTLDTGVALLTQGFANPSSGSENPTFPPASTFATGSTPVNLTVTGAPPAPEPASMLLLAAGLGALALRQYRTKPRGC